METEESKRSSLQTIEQEKLNFLTGFQRKKKATKKATSDNKNFYTKLCTHINQSLLTSEKKERMKKECRGGSGKREKRELYKRTHTHANVTFLEKKASKKDAMNRRKKKAIEKENMKE